MTRPLQLTVFSAIVVSLCLGALLPTWADQGGQNQAARPAEARDAERDADRAIGDLQRERPENVPIPPQPGRAARVPPGVVVPVNPAVVGALPNAERPALRREGEFIVNRRGRLVRSADGQHAIFTFDRQQGSEQDPPMILLPSQLLENMEDLVRDRGDQVSFIISGQVFLYRGTNFLMPTMMRLAVSPEHLRG